MQSTKFEAAKSQLRTQLLQSVDIRDTTALSENQFKRELRLIAKNLAVASITGLDKGELKLLIDETISEFSSQERQYLVQQAVKNRSIASTVLALVGNCVTICCRTYFGFFHRLFGVR